MTVSLLQAQTPYTLGGLEKIGLKVKSMSESPKLTQEMVEPIQKIVEKRLNDAGIVTKGFNPITLVFKVDLQTYGKTDLLFIEIILNEEVITHRKGAVPTYARTYYMQDVIETESPIADAKESILDFLLLEFIEQYKEENEE